MILEQFLRDIGCAPATISRGKWVNNDYVQEEVPNTNVIVDTARKPERELVENNLHREVVYARLCGPAVFFGFRIHGGYAFYKMNRAYSFMMERIPLSSFKKLIDAYDKYNEVKIVANVEDKMNVLLMTEELGGKK